MSEASFAVSFGYRSDNNTDTPIQSPFLQVTFQIAVLEKSLCPAGRLCETGVFSASQARLTWLSPRGSFEKKFTGGFMAAVLFYRCALREDSAKHAFFYRYILVLRCYPQEVESFSYHYRLIWDLCALGVSVLGYLLDMLGYLLCHGVGLSTR